jgi:hypothetical protein
MMQRQHDRNAALQTHQHIVHISRLPQCAAVSYYTFTQPGPTSTSKMRVAPPGILPPAPASPYPSWGGCSNIRANKARQGTHGTVAWPSTVHDNYAHAQHLRGELAIGTPHVCPLPRM